LYRAPTKSVPVASRVSVPIKQAVTPPKITPSSGLPTRLKIPNIHIDAGVENMGLTSSGELDTTKTPENVGWYKLGNRPGDNGTAVITGHFGWKNGMPAAFDNLHTLQAGDKLYVDDANGKAITFVVRQLHTYTQNEDATGVFSSSDGKAHLNLITCEGSWNGAAKSYSNRLVVFADKV
jgi:sortase A